MAHLDRRNEICTSQMFKSSFFLPCRHLRMRIPRQSAQAESQKNFSRYGLRVFLRSNLCISQFIVGSCVVSKGVWDSLTNILIQRAALEGKIKWSTNQVLQNTIFFYRQDTLPGSATQQQHPQCPFAFSHGSYVQKEYYALQQ